MDGLLFVIALLLMLVGFTGGIYSSLQKIVALLQGLSDEMRRQNGRGVE